MVRRGPACKLVRREPMEARVGSLSVVVVPPFGKCLACVRRAAEHGLVQQLGIMEQEHHFGGWWPRADFGFNEACPPLIIQTLKQKRAEILSKNF